MERERDSVLISKNGLNKMLIIEWVYEAHTKRQGLGGRDLKPASEDADKILCGDSILGYLSSPPKSNSI